MEHLIVLLALSGPTSPQDTEAAFTEAAGWFDQARRSAPVSSSEDVGRCASAYDDEVQFLTESGFHLDVVFSTTEGPRPRHRVGAAPRDPASIELDTGRVELPVPLLHPASGRAGQPRHAASSTVGRIPMIVDTSTRHV